jgi:signal transduction histidine kinase
LDLSRLVAEISQLLTASISKNLKLQLDLLPDLPGVKGDATQLRQIVMNLVRNSSEAMVGREGSIYVRTFEASDLPSPAPDHYIVNFVDTEAPANPSYVVMEVSDEGSGIDPKDLSSIFDPFFSTKFSVVQALVRHSESTCLHAWKKQPM